jgi:uncharacterized protein YxeA
MKSKKLLILIIPVLAIIIVIAALFLTRTKKGSFNYKERYK